MTHAIVVELFIDMKLVPMGEMPPVIDPRAVYGERHPPSRLIARDALEQFDVYIASYLRQLDVRTGILNGSRSLFLYGFMRYGDIFGKQYRHGFCGRYDGSRNDFVIHGDHRYNYSDDDSVETMRRDGFRSAADARPVSVLRTRAASS
jgi:hypothetical protein